jgi:DNA polymerase-1
MITFQSGGALLESEHELPSVPERIETLYLDFETSSGDPRLKSVDPWRDCSVIGASVKFNADGPSQFVPRHLLLHNGWLRDVLRKTNAWCNANVKYDMHVLKNDLRLDPPAWVRCTLTGAKLIDSERVFKGGYGLDVLSRDWLARDISQYEWAMQPYLGRDNKDYGQIPLDILAEYACVDTDVAATLDTYIESRMPEESAGVWKTEQAMTSMLYRMEQYGVRVDPTQLKIVQLVTLKKLLELDERMEQFLGGQSFRANVNDDCYDVLCNRYGLPVLAWTEPQQRKDGTIGTPGPSFDWDALQLYLQHPDAPHALVEMMIEYREHDTFNNLFLKVWDDLNVDGVMHPNYNQTVRTGRMGCSKPNMQQLNTLAKTLIVPPPGYAIVSADFSQIEFRIIAHYLENRQWVDAYNADPWVDAHDYVARMCGISRKPAKTLNFQSAYGGGKKKMIAAMSVNKEVVAGVIAEIEAAYSQYSSEARAHAVQAACAKRGAEVYDAYHRMLPELKPVSRQAAGACSVRGYVRNLYGRRRHLGAKFAHKAFNSAVQSTAGDLTKERMLALEQEVPELLQVTQVHDCVLGLLPLDLLEGDENPRVLNNIVDCMNHPQLDLRVPVRTTIGWSSKNWAEADEDSERRKPQLMARDEGHSRAAG